MPAATIPKIIYPYMMVVPIPGIAQPQSIAKSSPPDERIHQRPITDIVGVIFWNIDDFRIGRNNFDSIAIGLDNLSIVGFQVSYRLRFGSDLLNGLSHVVHLICGRHSQLLGPFQVVVQFL